MRRRAPFARAALVWRVSRPPGLTSRMPTPSVASSARQTEPLPGPDFRVPSPVAGLDADPAYREKPLSKGLGRGLRRDQRRDEKPGFHAAEPVRLGASNVLPRVDLAWLVARRHPMSNATPSISAKMAKQPSTLWLTS
jgi:hypothetical protein